MASRTYFEPTGAGVYIVCCARHGDGGSRRRGDVLIAPEGGTFYAPSRGGGSMRKDISVFFTDCPEHGELWLDSRKLADAVAKARRLGRMVPLRATPAR